MGSGISSLPAQIDKETFRHLVGGSVNDAVFDANSIAGIMTRDRLIELSNQRDAMLSHEWGFDDAGRDVGQIVRSVNMYLKSKGVVTYFDENEANERDGNSQDLGLIGKWECFKFLGFLLKMDSHNTNAKECSNLIP